MTLTVSIFLRFQDDFPPTHPGERIKKKRLLLMLLTIGYKNLPQPQGNSRHHCPAIPAWVYRSCSGKSQKLFLFVVFFTTVVRKRNIKFS